MIEASRISERAVIRFPEERVQHVALTDASYFDIAKSRVRQWLARGLNRLAVPGAIQPMELADKVTGQHIAVSVGELFVRISVNGRDYFFDRFSGRFDGTGKGCDC